MDRYIFPGILAAATVYAAALSAVFDKSAPIETAPLILHGFATIVVLVALHYCCARDNDDRALCAGLALLLLGFFSDAIGAVVALPKPFALLTQDVARLIGLMLAAAGSLKWLHSANELRASLDDLVYRDSVTGLLNRRGFLYEGEPALHESRQAGFNSAVIALEIDGFDKLTENHSSAFAEDVLHQFARHIDGAFRHHDRLAYWGDARFMVLLPRCEEQQCDVIAQRLKVYTTQHPIACNDAEIQLDAHCGIAAQGRNDAAASLQELVREASLALNHAKRSGGNYFSYSADTA